MSYVGALFVDGDRTSHDGDMIAAFVGDEVRGVATPTSLGSETIFFMLVYSNNSNETLSFKAYDASNDEVVDLAESGTFEANGVVGSVSSPFTFSGAGTVIESSAWIVNPADYQFTMNVVSAVFLEGVRSSGADDRLAAFVGSQVRGVASPTLLSGEYVFFMTVYANTAGETISFRFLEDSSGDEADLGRRIVFDADAVEGGPSQPVRLAPESEGPLPGMPTWTVNPAEFQNSMNVVAELQFEGDVSADEEDLLGAFVGDELRGVASPTELGGSNVFFVTIYSNSTDEDIRFEAYHASADEVVDLDQELPFESDGVEGSIGSPYLLTSGSSGVPDDGPDSWDLDPSDFELTMNLVAAVYLDGVRSSSPHDKLAAFVGDEPRGIATGVESGEDLFFFMTLYANRSGETVQFRAYDASEDDVRRVNSTLTFVPNSVFGAVGSPLSLQASVSNTCEPILTRVGDEVINIATDQPTLLASEIVLPDCIPDGSVIKYAWRQDAGPSFEFGAARTSSALNIPSGTLEPGAYVFELKAKVDGMPDLQATLSYSVVVEYQPIVALINGGTGFSQSRDDVLELDASASYDPNNTGDALSWTWDCVVSGGGTCVDSNTSLALVIPPTSVISIPAGSLDIGIYDFEATVSSANPNVASSMASTVVTILAGAPPSVTLQAATISHNLTEELTIDGSAENGAGGVLVYAWSSDPPLGLDDPGISSSGSDKEDLVILPNVLSSEVDYLFTLTTTNEDDEAGFASVEVTVYGVPTGGILTVDPVEGDELITSFEFSTSGWATESGSTLFYTFFAQPNPPSSLTLGSSALGEIVTQLSRGDPSDGDRLTVGVRATNEEGGFSEITTEIVVHPIDATVPQLVLATDQARSTDDGPFDRSLSLLSDVTVDETVRLEGYSLDLQGNTLILGVNAELQEADGQVFGDGSIVTVRNLNQPNDGNIGGLGVGIVTTDDLGDTEITREHTAVLLPGGETSIARTFGLEPDTAPSGPVTLRFTYTDADIEGLDPSGFSCYFYDVGEGEWSTDGVQVVARTDESITCQVDHLSEWTVGPSDSSSPVYVNVKALLEGPYDPDLDEMATDLKDGGHIPVSQPFGNADYDDTPISYDGSESVAAIPAGVVDWVLVELRTNSVSSSILASRAAFLREDGRIVDLDGTSKVQFSEEQTGHYFVVVRHRNHLPIMSATAIPFGSIGGDAGEDWDYDFSTSAAQAFGTGGLAFQETDVYAMVAGDANSDGEIQNGDKNDYLIPFLGSSGYLAADFDLNGTIETLDRTTKWAIRVGIGSSVPE